MFPKENLHKEILKITWLLLVLLTTAIFYYYIFPAFKEIINFIVPGILPFIFALVLAMLIEPLVEAFQKRFNFNRTLSTITVMVLFILIFSSVLVFLISRLLVELNKLSETIPIWSNWLTHYNAQAIVAKIKTFYISLHIPEYVLKVLQDMLNSLLLLSKKLVSGSINWIVGFVASLPYIFMVSVVMLVSTFFLSKDKNRIQDNLFKRLKPELSLKLTELIKDLNSALSGFFRAQIMLMSVTGLLTIIGLSLLGVDYVLTIGIITAVAEFMPIVGTGSIFVPWAIVVVFMGNVRLGVALLVLFAIIVTVRQIIEPKILSKNIGLHPLAALMSLFIGLKILGAWGIILGPSVLVLIKSLRKAKLI